MKITLNILLLFTLYQSSAQNLVPNPSFEDTVSTPCNGSSFPSIEYWMNPTQGSPDYYHQCSSSLTYGVPENEQGFQNARSGIAYTGILTYWESSTNYREYIEVQLTQPLSSGINYYWSFWISKADHMDYASNNIGIALLQNQYLSTTTEEISLNPIGNLEMLIYDSTDWVQICGNFIATGGENYLIIGNFYDNSQTAFDQTQDWGSQSMGAYYYIDDVYLSADFMSCTNNVGLDELTKSDKKLLRIIDIVGREIEDKPNTFQIYIYSDGTSEKVYKVE